MAFFHLCYMGMYNMHVSPVKIERVLSAAIKRMMLW